MESDSLIASTSAIALWILRFYGIKLDHALLVVAIPEMPAEVFWFEPAAMTDYWQQWVRRVAAYWKRRRDSEGSEG